jgi:hypothetical protein
MRKLFLSLTLSIWFTLPLLCALVIPSARAQTIVTQPVSQTVQVGQWPTFTVIVSGGPCRSFWTINGAGYYGPYLSTISYTLPKATLAMNGWQVQVNLFGCSGGTASLNTSTVTLSVVPGVTLSTLAIITAKPIIGIGQTDSLTVNGNYSDGSTKNLTSTAVWTSASPSIASVSAGTVLGGSSGSAIITATVGSVASQTTVTVEPVLNVTFAPLYDDGTAPPLQLVVSQVITNADGTTNSTPVLQLPDPTTTALTGSFLVNKAYEYDVALWKVVNNGDGTMTSSVLGQPMPYPAALVLSLMSNISQANFGVTLFKSSGLVKSFSSSAQ